MSTPEALARKRLGVTGLVQGVGFRPFVYRLVKNHRLSGWVRNTSKGVEIEVQGPTASLETFIRELASQAPALARVDRVVAEDAQPLQVPESCQTRSRF